MTKELLKSYLEDLRCVRLFHKRYKPPKNRSRKYWRMIMRRYGNMEKTLLGSDYRWRIITYDDGHKELAYLRVLQGGILSGAYPAIYRGIIIPRRIDYGTFAHIDSIKLAF